MKRRRTGRVPYAEIYPDLIKAVAKDMRRPGMNRYILADRHQLYPSTLVKWEKKMPNLKFRRTGPERRRIALLKAGKYKKTKKLWDAFQRLYAKKSEKEVCRILGISRPTYWKWSLDVRNGV